MALVREDAAEKRPLCCIIIIPHQLPNNNSSDPHPYKSHKAAGLGGIFSIHMYGYIII